MVCFFRRMSSAVNIRVDPSTSLIDEELTIKATGLTPGAPVTIVAQTSERDIRFYSNASFLADKHGEINLAEMAPISGRYEGKMPMGLICSLIQEPGQAPGRRLIKKDVTSPLDVKFSLLSGQINQEDILLQDCTDAIASAICHRWYMAPGVTRVPITEGRLKGTMFIPQGEGPFPGVIDMFGTVGGTVEHRAALLASRGFVTLALRYFDPPKDLRFSADNPTVDFSESMVTDMEYYVNAVDKLLEHPKVGKFGIGVIGTSKGAELALLLTVCCPMIRACITIGGTLFNQLAPHTYKNQVFPPAELHLDMGVGLEKDGTVNFGKMYAAQKRAIHEKYYIPIEKSTNGSFLVLYGDDDQVYSPDIPQAVAKRLQAHGKSNYDIVVYKGAGHLIEPPFSPLTWSSFHASFNAVCAWGGYITPHAEAQSDAWIRIQKFLRERLSPQSSL